MAEVTESAKGGLARNSPTRDYFLYLDVGELVQKWFQGLPNEGLILIGGEETPDSAKRFYARELATSGERRPQLIAKWALPAPTETPLPPSTTTVPPARPTSPLTTTLTREAPTQQPTPTASLAPQTGTPTRPPGPVEALASRSEMTG